MILRKSNNCLNCGHEIKEEDFCSKCGQKNTNRNVSIHVFFQELIEDTFEIDSKLFRSLKPLLFKPGFLTIEFNSGKRAKYVSPIRMYLVISLLFFLIPSPDKSKKNENIRNGHSEMIDGQEKVTEGIALKSDSTESSTKRKFNIDIPGLDTIKDFENLTETKVYHIVNKYLHKKEIDTSGFWGQVLGYVSVKGVQVQQKGSDNFWDELQENFPTMMFFLLPIFALILKLLYYKKKKLYVEFLLFSLHFHCFAFIISSIDQLIELTTGIDLGTILVLLIFFYLIVAMKKVFDKRYLTTFLRFFMLFFFYGVSIILAFVSTLLWTIVMY
ncbi:MAG: DUF3667 domain-containing protein [Bacteroidia bacterium]|nr:DUF3667 domain-containing protein [Bacteroidia bacterium]